ncbi:MAG: chemotaxis protein CheW [Blastocatellia bacterium]|nr:chemotaxis protein CheW [Blastocatellia bacterium]
MSKGKKAKGVQGKPAWGAIPMHLDEPETSKGKANQVSVLTFTVNDELMALRVEHTEGVVDCPRISPLPSPPDPIIGVASVRGRMTLVCDLSLNAARKAAKRRLILIKGEAQLGLLADRLEGVIALSPKKIRPVSSGKQPVKDRNSKGEFDLPTASFFKSGNLRVHIIDVERLADM